jgi:hypothetical protein
MMSDTPADESLAVRMQRDRAESDKFRAEGDTLRDDYQKLFAGQVKLYREAEKLHWDKFLSPLIAIGGLIVGALGLLIAFFKH